MAALPHARYEPVRLAQVRPRGWLLEFLRRQCAGITGHPQASGYPLDHTFWDDPSRLPDVADPAMAWWPYEQTAYWVDGALKAGFLAGDESVRKLAVAQVEGAIANAAPDGFIGPEMFRDRHRWAYLVFFRAVLTQYALTGDRRLLDALVRHYRSTPHPMGFARDVSGVEILLALYAETGEPDLLEQATDLYARFNAQDSEHGRDFTLTGMRSDRPVTTHGVSFNELAKLGALMYAATGDRDNLDATVHAYAKVERDHLLADGLHSGAEAMSGNGPLESHETCTISDHTWSLGHLLQITGDPRYADRLERVVFNALPGAVTKDFTALQYFSCTNQVVATNASNHNPMSRGDNRMSFRPGHPVQCCTGNVQRALPNYVERMWMRGPGDDDEIVAALFGPSRIEVSLAGTPVTIEAQTRYPFEQGVTFTVTPQRPARFTFTVRIPKWCQEPVVTVAGEPVDQTPTPGTLCRIDREWQPGDRVEVKLPFPLTSRRWADGGISLELGPLTLSLPVSTTLTVDTEDDWEQTPVEFRLSGPQHRLPEFPAYKLVPESEWAYALAVDERNLADAAEVVWTNTDDNDAFPLDVDAPAVRVSVPARRVRDWALVETERVSRLLPSFENGRFRMVEREVEGRFTLTPPLPAPDTLAERLAEETERIELVPYGNTLLRLTVFPAADAGS
ncbi:beta-L-arabinofuranosidase domain-containing protein [Actinopolymorpha sp. NPDC004070]|uniref:beta-L-arabinofuranosidase domain-containing protein n=1 Tax=Actinopolymorpha sp. NPDC004070 TaxID=3154548 RepID=UPI0033B56D31